MQDTSWEKSGKWYKNIVGDEGHYYHQKIVLPNSLRLLKLEKGNSLLDLACGQGVLERQIGEEIDYVGIDLSPTLIEEARLKSNKAKHIFGVADVSKVLPIDKKDFSHAAIILALQNIRKAFGVVRNAKDHLKSGGKLLIILNHPAFRIPKFCHWEIDQSQKVQYRRVDKYMKPIEIPILTNPGKGEKSEETWSFHYPISAYSEMLFDNGFMIEKIEEWVSDKISTGGAAEMENKARKEFPMFMAILAKKN
ncbi:MAG: class I SAM-dependent methyltransferase [Candidatus Shapirobacteria bacterium]